jgi:hypothetical protein
MKRDQKRIFEQYATERRSELSKLIGYCCYVTRHHQQNAFVDCRSKLTVNDVKQHISPKNPEELNSGVMLLAEARLLHFSLEQLVIDFAEAGLFSEDEIASAKARIVAAKTLTRENVCITPTPPHSASSRRKRRSTMQLSRCCGVPSASEWSAFPTPFAFRRVANVRRPE